MGDHPYYLLDVFAETSGSGNPLTVILDADDIPDSTQATLARRLRLSETSFVQSPGVAGATYRHRIWTPTGEIPFAGHPSVGTAVAVAIHRGLAAADVVQETPSGLQPLHVAIDDDRRGGSANLRQGPLRVDRPIDVGAVLRAFGLEPDDAYPGLPAQVISTGLDTLVLPLRDVEALGRARMDIDAVTAAFAAIDAPSWLNGYFVTPVDGTAADATTWRARNLAPDIVGYEDPATGSAAGPFGGWLALHGGPSRVTVLQGIEMGDPSRIDVDTSDGIVVTGRVLVRATGSITF